MTSMIQISYQKGQKRIYKGCHNVKKPSKIDHNGSILEGYKFAFDGPITSCVQILARKWCSSLTHMRFHSGYLQSSQNLVPNCIRAFWYLCVGTRPVHKVKCSGTGISRESVGPVPYFSEMGAGHKNAFYASQDMLEKV